MYIVFDCMCLMDLVATPIAINLSHWTGVEGCGWTISINAVWMGTSSWALMSTVPNSTSAADVIMLRNILQKTCTRPFIISVSICISYPSMILSERKIYQWLCFWLWRQENRTHHYGCKESYRLRAIVLHHPYWAKWFSSLVTFFTVFYLLLIVR